MTPKKDNATAFITALEGNITTDLVKAELARLIPVNWTWSVQQHADGFVVPFPCNVELQRMVAMKYVHAAGGEGIMVIQELDQKIEPVQYLQKVWVNVYGVPYEIRSFLPLWAVGSILGATQKVDLRYTRKMGVVRILVGVINVDSIPESSDIVVGEGLYEIYFKVDKVCKDGVWMDYKQEVSKDKGDDDQQDEEFDGLDEYIHKTDAAFQDTEMEDKSTNNNGNPQDNNDGDMQHKHQDAQHDPQNRQAVHHDYEVSTVLGDAVLPHLVTAQEGQNTIGVYSNTDPDALSCTASVKPDLLLQGSGTISASNLGIVSASVGCPGSTSPLNLCLPQEIQQHGPDAFLHRFPGIVGCHEQLTTGGVAPSELLNKVTSPKAASGVMLF